MPSARAARDAVAAAARASAADCGSAGLHRSGNTRHQSPAADPDDDGVEIGHVIHQLETEGALAGDDVGVTKGADQHRARTFSELGGEARWCLDGRSLEDDVSPVTAGRQELRDRHTEGHEDRRGDAELVSRQRDALCVIARRSGDDSTRTLRLREAGEPVGRAANLERAGPLQVLGFAEHLGAEPIVEDR